MNYIKTLVAIVAIVAMSAFSNQALAQKVAYVESEAIIMQMPAYKKAKSEVEAYGKQLQKVLEGKQKEAELYYAEVMKKVQDGGLSPKQEQEAQAKLQQMQADLQKEASDADRKLMEKEGELTKPMYEDYNNAIAKVAKENGFGYVMDKKLMLYSAGGVDITEKVKTALGISW